MNEIYTTELLSLGTTLAELAVKGTATAVSTKIRAIKEEKNIDKNKIENIANSYQGKSEDELLDELINIGKNLKGKEEVVSKFKNFLNPEQQQKLDSIMNKISEAEITITAREIVKRIEAELDFPGQIKVNVIRETRAVEYAK